MKAIVALTTVPDIKTASKISKFLISKKLAACVTSIDKVSSCYRWKGKVENSREVLLLIKTTQARYSALEVALKKHHPYDLPEILALSVPVGSKKYLKWVAGSVA